MAFNAYKHAILIGCLHDNGDVTFTSPFASPNVWHLGPGRVIAFVNDDQYPDNRGTIDVLVYAWT